ncbi:Mpo1-like protein [Acidovorax sp. BLS4]|uniref:Mpo1 family 2-hydroxy fatty acid dioxygenase n=1 Tax=Acidovorax sp. BLS4 TaxID=3273430 RepID=UPI002942DCBA|nr:Mpo1-like protein [Paracidovorax avenae]WOI46823.1 Mpo1-like protein [Paracidovorax avenae]
MKTLIDHLSGYADYHRDPRNIHTHFIGVPMIMLAVTVLLSRPAAMLGGLPVSLALLAALAACVFYFRLDVRYGVTMALALAAMLAVGQWLAAQSTALWLGAGLGLFVVGWVIQFVGHYYEGRKPAFVDDLVGLLVGPLFVAAELGFAMGLRREVQAAIEARSGPVRLRPHGQGTAA